MKNLFLLFTFFTCVCMTTRAQQTPDVFTYRVGSFKVSLLSEAQQDADPVILIGATPEILNKYVPTGSFRNAMNAFLVQNDQKNILVDTGLGQKLFANLYTLGVKPEDVDIILITHMHGDHIGGLLQNGEVTFPRAEIYLSQPEYDYWTSDEEMHQVPEDRRRSFTYARDVIEAYKDRLHLFMPNPLGKAVPHLVSGFTPVEAYGHTPGHTAYLLDSGNSRLMIWGDLTHAMAVQMPHPEIAVTYDVNPEIAIESRERILKFVKERYIPIAGMHIAYPGMGRITADPENPEKSYLFTPLQ